MESPQALSSPPQPSAAQTSLLTLSSVHLYVMRIVVKNIRELQEAQIQEILREWIPVSTDPACYLSASGSYYANVTSEALKALAADFNSRLKPQLGPGACIQVAAVQELPKTPKSKKLAGGIKNDESFNNYLENPDTWRLEQVKRKQRKAKKGSASASTSAAPSAPSSSVSKPDKGDQKKKKKKPKPKTQGDPKGKQNIDSKGAKSIDKPKSDKPETKPEKSDNKSKPKRKANPRKKPQPEKAPGDKLSSDS